MNRPQEQRVCFFMNSVANIPYPINNFYNRTLLTTAVPAFVHNMFAMTKDIPEGNTDTIKFRKLTRLSVATTPLVEGVTPPGSSIVVTDITATIQQYGDFLAYTDKVSFTSIDPILTDFAMRLGDQSGDTLDQISRDVLVAGTNVLYASTATARNQITAAMKLTVTEVKNAVRILKNANARKITRMIDPSTGIQTVPVNSCFVAFIHPDTTADLKSQPGFVPVEMYPSQAGVMPHEVGKMDEVRFIESTNAKIFTGAGASSVNVYATIIVAMEAYAQTRISGHAMENIVKALGSGGTEDALNQRGTTGWKATYVCKRTDETFMIRVEHGTTYS